MEVVSLSVGLLSCIGLTGDSLTLFLFGFELISYICPV